MTAKYKVKNISILHNGKLYADGSTIELTEKEAKRLEDLVEFIAEVQPKTQTKTTTKTDVKTENKTDESNSQKGDVNNDK